MRILSNSGAYMAVVFRLEIIIWCHTITKDYLDHDYLIF